MYSNIVLFCLIPIHHMLILVFLGQVQNFLLMAHLMLHQDLGFSANNYLC